MASADRVAGVGVAVGSRRPAVDDPSVLVVIHAMHTGGVVAAVGITGSATLSRIPVSSRRIVAVPTRYRRLQSCSKCRVLPCRRYLCRDGPGRARPSVCGVAPSAVNIGRRRAAVTAPSPGGRSISPAPVAYRAPPRAAPGASRRSRKLPHCRTRQPYRSLSQRRILLRRGLEQEGGVDSRYFVLRR